MITKTVTEIEFENGDFIVKPKLEDSQLTLFAIVREQKDDILSTHAFRGFCRSDILLDAKTDAYRARIATDDEKRRFIEIMAEQGYKWDEEKKEVVKIPKDKVEEYEPIGKVYRDRIEINPNVTRDDLLLVIEECVKLLKEV